MKNRRPENSKYIVVWRRLPLLLLLFLQLTAFAEIPKTLSYQGILSDSAGMPLPDGEYDMFFSLFEAETGGLSIWDEPLTVQLVNGVFNAELGSFWPLTLDFDKPYWLEVEYNGDVLTPRTKLTAAAYSMNTIDIPDSIVTTEKIADGNVVRSINGFTDAVSFAAGLNVTLTPQGNTLIIAAGDSLNTGGGDSPWLNVGTGLAYTGGDVGVGTNTPKARVHSHLPAGSTTPGFYSVNTNADYTAPAGQPLQLGHWNPNTSTFTERMRLTVTGNVGINTDAPNAKLGIVNDGTATGLWINQTSTTGFGSALVVDQAQGLSPAAQVNAASGSGAGMRIDKDGGSGHALDVLHNGAGSAVHARQWGSGPAISVTNSGGAANEGVMLDIENTGLDESIRIMQSRPGNIIGISDDPNHLWTGNGVIDIRLTEDMNNSVLDSAVLKVRTVGRPLLDLWNDNTPGVSHAKSIRIGSGDGWWTGLGDNGASKNIATLAINQATGEDRVLNLQAWELQTPESNFRFIDAWHWPQGTQFRVDGDGRAYSDEGFTGSGADFAEMVEVADDIDAVEPGDVMVISASKDRAMERSSIARSTMVMGIYSTKPGFVGSERDWDAAGPTKEESKHFNMADMKEAYNEVPLAVVGIVPCKVSAENGAIRRGDLLVTAATPGHAMRDDNPKNGTIVGKALGRIKIRHRGYQGAGNVAIALKH